jgi:hypothetical protein
LSATAQVISDNAHGDLTTSRDVFLSREDTVKFGQLLLSRQIQQLIGPASADSALRESLSANS